jgi:uncharacterized protein YaaQ
MKLIITIMRDTDSESVSQALVEAGYRVTRVASTGGFWRRGSSTLMIGVDDAKVEEATGVIRKSVSTPGEPGGSWATLFVLPVEQFAQF